jgi:hypothetical protein
MTRKDYQTLAKVVRANQNNMPYNALAYLIGTLSNELQADNPRFDRDRFWDACLEGYKRGGQ